MSYTDEQVKYIKELRNSGLEWQEVADAYNERYPTIGDPKTPTAIRKTYSRYRDDDISDETLVKNITTTYSARKAASKLRKENKALIESGLMVEHYITAVKEAVKDIKPIKVKKRKKTKGKNMTIELLFSDIQIGKITPSYNSEVARLRIIEYARAVIFKIEQHIASGYNVEKIVLAILGDIIEMSEKHYDSMRATDHGTPEQIRMAIQYIHNYVIIPLAELGIDMDVVCITGNHSNAQGGIKSHDPGKEHLSWPIYHALDMLSKSSGFKHVKFDIPIGAFTTYKIYGSTILYEHGCGITVTDSGMKAHASKRSLQRGEFIDFIRIGDRHQIQQFSGGRYIVNGAMFSADGEGREYSSIKGYSSYAEQLMLCYVEREEGDPRSPLYDSFTVQLEHIGE